MRFIFVISFNVMIDRRHDERLLDLVCQQTKSKFKISEIDLNVEKQMA